ncbi:MAG: hypothetical protein IH851_06895 [Armatimonadetes bacterium]|nr:hypothetical protein [Armatimonadota bacterium]
MRRIGIWILSALVAGVTAVYLNLETWQLYREQMDLMRQGVERLRQAERQKAELQEEKARLNTPVGMEEAARRNGYRKPGEEPLRTEP